MSYGIQSPSAAPSSASPLLASAGSRGATSSSALPWGSSVCGCHSWSGTRRFGARAGDGPWRRQADDAGRRLVRLARRRLRNLRWRAASSARRRSAPARARQNRRAGERAQGSRRARARGGGGGRGGEGAHRGGPARDHRARRGGARRAHALRAISLPSRSSSGCSRGGGSRGGPGCCSALSFFTRGSAEGMALLERTGPYSGLPSSCGTLYSSSSSPPVKRTTPSRPRWLGQLEEALGAQAEVVVREMRRLPSDEDDRQARLRRPSGWSSLPGLTLCIGSGHPGANAIRRAMVQAGITFSEADAASERGRTLGFAAASMIPVEPPHDAGPMNPVPAPSPPAVPEPPPASPPPPDKPPPMRRRAFSGLFEALAIDHAGLEGEGPGLGGGLAVEVIRGARGTWR